MVEKRKQKRHVADQYERNVKPLIRIRWIKPASESETITAAQYGIER
jgi:hypothetical protein